MHSMTSPFCIPHITTAYDRITTAIKNKESILIYGDKDVDGITSIAIVYHTLRQYTDKIFFYAPDSKSGYGMNKTIIDNFTQKHSISLIITVDCGISNKDQFR